MNNLIFLDHILLFEFDRDLKTSPLFPEYLSIYQSFPYPPSVEYFVSRNMIIDLHGPWNLEPTSFPMPAFPSSPITFEDAADSFGLEMCQEIDNGKDIYLMWSGGIDSTVLAVSLLKHIQPHQRDKLTVVSSFFSQRENPIFYHKFLKNFKQIDVMNFDPANINLKNSIILDGEGGDQIFGSSGANAAFSLNPDKILLPWRKNLDFLRDFYHDSTPGFVDYIVDLMNKTINHSSMPIETLFDFFWWLNFNFKLDCVSFRQTLRMCKNITDQDFEYFTKHVMRRFYISKKIQQWSMSATAPDKINVARKTVKWAGRKYIYDFDHNEYYFREKRKEFSFIVKPNPSTIKYFAIDKNYQRYSFRDRETRQQIGKIFQLNG